MEGLFVFHYEETCELLDLKIFIDADEDTNSERRIHRDAHERGYPERSVLYQGTTTLHLAFEQYLLPYKKHEGHHRDHNTSFDRGLEVLVHHSKAR